MEGRVVEVKGTWKVEQMGGVESTTHTVPSWGKQKHDDIFYSSLRDTDKPATHTGSQAPLKAEGINVPSPPKTCSWHISWELFRECQETMWKRRASDQDKSWYGQKTD